MRRTPGLVVGGALCPDSNTALSSDVPDRGVKPLLQLNSARSIRLWLAAWLGLAGFFSSVFAQLVAPPDIDWVSIPGSASLGQTVNVGVGAHGNYSDNSDGNEWNEGGEQIILITVKLWRPGASSPEQIYDWLPTPMTPAEIWTSFTANSAGTHYIEVQAMDWRPWFSGVYSYAVSATSPLPTITSQLTVAANQGFTTSYTITAMNSPTSFTATPLPAGLTFNAATGVISGRVTGTTSPVSTVITATNAQGTDTKTLTWTITSAVITPASSVSPSSVQNGAAVTLTRDGWANFGIAWIENVIWKPNNTAQVLGNMQPGSMSYTPDAGPGTYHYQTRIVDTSAYNYVDQWIAFTVAALPAPTGLTASNVQPTSVTLGWNAVSGAAGYNVYRDGVKLNTAPLTALTYTDPNAVGGTAYVYSVKAVDAQGYESAANLLNLTTPTGASFFEVFLPLP
jgi:hypothetical protein